MVYRLLLTFGLLVLPLTTAEAAYQQKLRIPAESTVKTQDATTSADDVRPVKNEEGVSVWDTDGTAIMTRAVFTANLIRGMYNEEQINNCFWDIAPSHPPRFELVFTDVTVDHPYAKEICMAMREGIIRGYLDGSFGPDRILTFAESAKIMSRAYVLAPYAHADMRNPWYSGHVRALITRNAIPTSITKLSQQITAAEAREMLDRLENGVTWRPSQTEEVLFPPVIIRRPAVVPAATTGSSSSTASSGAASSKSSVMPGTAASTASSAVSQMPASSASSKEGSFWDLF